jgi:acetyl-CoA carboxylase biotin carboxyl carrier protein
MPEIRAEVTGSVWKVECQAGEAVQEDQTLVILESMKMEFPVDSELAGTVREVRVAEGDSVAEGDVLVVVD